MNASGRELGEWFGGFVIPMLFSYILLRLAGSPKRGTSAAIILRVVAVVIAILLTYAPYSLPGGTVNPGGVAAVVVALLWALRQQFFSKSVSHTTDA